jgi:hypothetical protein
VAAVIERYFFALNCDLTLGEEDDLLMEGSPRKSLIADLMLINFETFEMTSLNIEKEILGSTLPTPWYHTVIDDNGNMLRVPGLKLSNIIIHKDKKVYIEGVYNGAIPNGFKAGDKYTMCITMIGKTYDD